MLSGSSPWTRSLTGRHPRLATVHGLFLTETQRHGVRHGKQKRTSVLNTLRFLMFSPIAITTQYDIT